MLSEIALVALAVLQEGAAPAASFPAPQRAEPAPIPVRIGDLSDIRGVRVNQLHGLGLVIGLAGTGDQQNATKQAISNFLKLSSFNVAPSDVSAGNCALVAVTATLDPFKSNGARIDVTVSALMDAKSLSGGFLIQTELRGADGQTYAVAQGALSVGGSYQGVGQAGSATKGHLTVATIPNGAIVEQEVPMQMVNDGGIMKLDLRNPDFNTAKRVVEAVNEAFPGSAEARSAGEVWVHIPPDLEEAGGLVPFIASVSGLRVVPDSLAVIVINERTGTLVSGENVRIGRAAVAHGPLTIAIEESPIASQPGPLSGGNTEVLPRTSVTVDEKKLHAQVFPGVVSVVDFVEYLKKLEVSSRDMIAILQALKKAGAIHAELVIM